MRHAKASMTSEAAKMSVVDSLRCNAVICYAKTRDSTGLFKVGKKLGISFRIPRDSPECNNFRKVKSYLAIGRYLPVEYIPNEFQNFNHEVVF